MAASQPRLMPMAKSLPSNEDLHERANDILPPINAIQQIGGTQTMAEHHLGFADVENQRAANSMTRYPIGFLFKAFVVAIVAQLVHEKQLQWHELITTYLPELSSMAGPMPADQLTLIDLLSHQTGLARLDAMWLGANNEINAPKHSTLAMCKQLPAFHRPHSEWLYNNWMYSLAGEIIGRVSNSSWGQALESRVLDQVGLSQTSVIESKVPSGSTALPYAILNDKTKWRIGSTGLITETSCPQPVESEARSIIYSHGATSLHQHSTAKNSLSISWIPPFQATTLSTSPRSRRAVRARLGKSHFTRAVRTNRIQPRPGRTNAGDRIWIR
jgi:CubicO group peptidase (beta-lactamase class C family)